MKWAQPLPPALGRPVESRGLRETQWRHWEAWNKNIQHFVVFNLGWKLLSCSQCQKLGQRANLDPDWLPGNKEPIRSKLLTLTTSQKFPPQSEDLFKQFSNYPQNLTWIFRKKKQSGAWLAVWPNSWHWLQVKSVRPWLVSVFGCFVFRSAGTSSSLFVCQ